MVFACQHPEEMRRTALKHGSIPLQGKTITLRKFAMTDAPLLHEKLGCNPEMMRFTGWNPYRTLESVTRFVSEVIEGYEQEQADYSWIIEANGSPVGIIGAYDFDKESNSLEIGYSVFQEHWGKGYASEALGLVCEYLLLTERIRCLKAWSAAANSGSKRVLEKAGFVQTSVKEAALNVEGQVFDQVFYKKL